MSILQAPQFIHARALVAICSVVAAAICAPEVAFAHAHLKTSEPAANSTVDAAPKALSLHFTEAVEASFSGVQVSGPTMANMANMSPPVVADKIEVNPADHTNVTVALPAKLASGQYQVKWHALATDGHKTNGDYSFTVK